MPGPRHPLEAWGCRAPFSDSKRGLESPETGIGTGTEGTGLKGSGPSGLCAALRNCQGSVGDLRPWARTSTELRGAPPRNPLSFHGLSRPQASGLL